MKNPIEAAGKYALSIADRATGFSGFKEILRNAAGPSSERFTQSSIYKVLGAIAPAATRVAISIENKLPEHRGPIDMLSILPVAIPAALDVYIGVALIDAAIPFAQLMIEGRNPLASIVHNPLEAVTAKLMINSATNVGWDLGHEGIKLAKSAVHKIRNLKPPVTPTLAA